MTINLPDGSEVSSITLPDGSDVSEVRDPDGNVVFGPIPDSVVSRPADGISTSPLSDSLGLVINMNGDFGGIGARISQNVGDGGDNPTRARLYDYNASSYIDSVDISGLSAGDTFTFNSVTLTSGQEYGIELDRNGSGYVSGIYGSPSFPYTGTDFDIVGRSNNGSKDTTNAPNVNDIGDTGF